MKTISLTIMCMVTNEKNEILVQNRLKNDWPGINFPGGHVEDNENIMDACKREMKEETNLDVFDLECKGYYEWNNIEPGIRHLSILFRTSSYKGTLKSSSEGEMFFVKAEDFPKYKQANDFIKVYEEMIK